MSTQKKNQKHSLTFNGFGGVNRALCHGEKLLADDVENFRILEDGTLEKRSGFGFVTDLGTSPRATYRTIIGGKETLFVLLNSMVCILDCESGDLSEIGTIESSEGNACFFHFKESLFLLDGVKVYEYADNSFREVLGYVPLVAKDWQNDVVGDIWQPRNILNRHARATFIISDPPSSFLCVGEPVESVEAVYLNNALLKPERYSIDEGFNAISVQGLDAGDRVELFFTYKNGYDTLLSRLCSSVSSALFGGIGSSRIFLCGGNGSGTVFGSKNVTDLELAASKKLYPQSNGLYFPASYAFDAGNGINEVQAIVRSYDRILIFTEGDVWMISPDEGSDASGAVSVNPWLGCPVGGGGVALENDAVSIGNGSVWRWSRASESGYKAQCLSAPIDPTLSKSFLSNCGIFYYATRRELWLYNKTQKIAWIYGEDAKAWYSFTGFCADFMTEINGAVIFIKDGELYRFYDGKPSDTDNQGIEHLFSAKYVTNTLDFGVERNKNLASVTLSGDLRNGNILLKFDTNTGESLTCEISDEKNYEHSIINARLCSGRFKYGTLTISSPAGRWQKIHRLTLSAR